MYDEPRTSGTARVAATLGTLSLLLLVAAGPLHHLGLVGLAGAFAILKWAVYGAAATLVLAVVALIIAARRWSSKGAALTALVLALISLGSVGALAWKASRLPAIHDVSTDPVQPPPFLAVTPLRVGAPNSVEYGGPAVAEKQRAAYPDLQPVRPERSALARLRSRAAGGTGDGVGAGGVGSRRRTHRSHRHHLLVRVQRRRRGPHRRATGRQPDRCPIVSRAGVGDLGANAARIRRYLAAVKTS